MLAVLKNDKTNTSHKLASDEAEVIKTLRITPHGDTKFHRLRHTWTKNRTLPCQM